MAWTTFNERAEAIDLVRLADRRVTAARVTRIGTNSGENLYGTGADDRIEGLGGSDWLYGWDGNDVLFGGDGNDRLNGERGRDVLYGGEGDDRLYAYSAEGDRLYGGNGTDLLEMVPGLNVVEGGPHGLLDGGEGDDWLTFNGSGGRVFGGAGVDRLMSWNALDAVIDMGAEADLVSLYDPIGRIRIDLGDGNDQVQVQQATGHVVITLGAGDDSVLLARNIHETTPFRAIVITDFTPGSRDRVDISSLFFEAGIKTDNGFRDGYLRLLQRGANTELSFDHDLDGKNWDQLVIFRNTDADAFTGDNLGIVGDITSPSDTAALSL